MVEDNLDKFIDEIIAAKNLSGISEDVALQLRSDLRDKLTDQVNSAMINALDESKLDEFNALLDQEAVSDEQIKVYIEQSGVDTTRIAAQTMLRFRDLYLGTN